MLVVSLLLLVLAYKPADYDAIDPNSLIKRFNEGKYKSNVNLIKVIAGTTADNVISIRENNKSKKRYLRICAYLTLASLIFIILLNIFQHTR
jgi:hypothetical protein